MNTGRSLQLDTTTSSSEMKTVTVEGERHLTSAPGLLNLLTPLPNYWFYLCSRCDSFDIVYRAGSRAGPTAAHRACNSFEHVYQKAYHPGFASESGDEEGASDVPFLRDRDSSTR